MIYQHVSGLWTKLYTRFNCLPRFLDVHLGANPFRSRRSEEIGSTGLSRCWWPVGRLAVLQSETIQISEHAIDFLRKATRHSSVVMFIVRHSGDRQIAAYWEILLTVAGCHHPLICEDKDVAVLLEQHSKHQASIGPGGKEAYMK